MLFRSAFRQSSNARRGQLLTAIPQTKKRAVFSQELSRRLFRVRSTLRQDSQNNGTVGAGADEADFAGCGVIGNLHSTIGLFLQLLEQILIRKGICLAGREGSKEEENHQSKEDFADVHRFLVDMLLKHG